MRELESVFGADITRDTEEAAARIRALVFRITVMPDGDGLKLQLEGRLSALMQAPSLYPNMRIAASGGSVVAEDRFRRKPRHPDVRYYLRSWT